LSSDHASEATPEPAKQAAPARQERRQHRDGEKQQRGDQKRDFEKSPFYAGKQQVDLDMEPLDNETMTLNKEFLYDQKHRKHTN
jgi:hypothetical protein